MFPEMWYVGTFPFFGSYVKHIARIAASVLAHLVLGCAAKVLQIVRTVRDEAMTRQALVQIRARVMHSVRAVGVLNVCIRFLLNEARLMQHCMHCHVQARMCLRMRSRVHLNVACARPAYMSVQAIACSMGLPKKMEPNQVPILGTRSWRVSCVVANGGAYLECAPRGLKCTFKLFCSTS